MKKTHFIQTLSALLACLTLASCAAQAADPPVLTAASNSTTSAQTSTVSTTSASITTDGSAPITTTGTSSTDAAVPTVTPGTTKDDVPTTGSTPITSEADPTQSAMPGTTKQDPVTGPTTNGQTTPKPNTSSQTPETSKTPETTTKKVETPTPTPHTHSWSSWTVTKAATCTAAGSQKRTCSGCSEVQTQTIAAIGHSYSSKVTTSATCTKAGFRTYTCSKCKDTYTESIPATGHNWGAWVVTKEPTTGAEGVEMRTCSKCGKKETRSIDKLPQTVDPEWMAQRFLELLNEERAKAGVQQLVTDARIHEIAKARADELTILFDHYRPNGTSSGTIFNDFKYGNYYDFTQYGLPESYNYYSPAKSGEDIGAGALFSNESIEDYLVWMITGFKNSPGHWNDMMNNVYGAVGIAISYIKYDGDPGFPDVYDCYIEILLVDRLYE